MSIGKKMQTRTIKALKQMKDGLKKKYKLNKKKLSPRLIAKKK